MIDHYRIKRRIQELARVGRKYAPFFDWFKNEKEIKEIGIARILLENIEMNEKPPFNNLKISPKDPPDVLAETEGGARIGIEVSELVDEEVVRKWERDEEVFKFWQNHEVIESIQGIINRKDAKKFHGGPYEKIYILIYTADPLLEYEKFEKIISEHVFDRNNQIDGGYILFSYNHNIGYCPYICLKFYN